jgi:hypothetical protein
MPLPVVADAIECEAVVVRRPSRAAFRLVYAVGERSSIGAVRSCDPDFVAVAGTIASERNLAAVVRKGSILLVLRRRQKRFRGTTFFESEQIGVETATDEGQPRGGGRDCGKRGDAGEIDALRCAVIGRANPPQGRRIGGVVARAPKQQRLSISRPSHAAHIA